MPATATSHPCFYPEARTRYGRIHLPVAPGCNISCLYCRRDYDCANESRPGVTSQVLEPAAALEHLERALASMPYLRVVGIAGPGDPFHQPARTLACLELVRSRHPELILCLSTNGYGLAPHVADLAELGVGFATLTINAVDPAVGAGLYQRVGVGEAARRGAEGAGELIARQFAALAALKARGLTVKVNTVVVPGLNQGQVGAIARRAGRLGADLMNLIPVIPLAGTPLAGQVAPHPALIRRLRQEARQHLPQMEHCQRCRADAVGLLGGSLPGCPTRP
ncbi:MAG: radical SAM protein [Deltaproteobacteria bacterium]|nr:radical SAM protein [Deltaproteobacteria bacterium]